MPVGSGAGHDPPTTPLELVRLMAVELIEPVAVAVPVQTVPSAATPLNESCVLIAEPLSVPFTSPVQAISAPCHVPLIEEPFCVILTSIASDGLFAEANVPVHAPEISVTLPTDTAVGLPGEPEQPHVTMRATTTRQRRMVAPYHKFRARLRVLEKCRILR